MEVWSTTVGDSRLRIIVHLIMYADVLKRWFGGYSLHYTSVAKLPPEPAM